MTQEEKFVQHKRSNVANKIPTAGQLRDGEIAVNYAKGSEALYIKNDSNEIEEFKPYKGIIEITYAEIKALRDNKALKPGQTYRITDFVTTSAQDETRSAGHPFDIIVVADNKETLNESARACLHEGDTYFATSNLESWELKYCLDNDTKRFAWADASNGKGVIWWMKDEFNNICFYDFKNIQYKVYAVSGSTNFDVPYRLTKNMTEARKGMTLKRTNDYTYAYTIDARMYQHLNESIDASLGGTDNEVYNNTIDCNYEVISEGDGMTEYSQYKRLYLNFFICIRAYGPYAAADEPIRFHGNTIGKNCHDIVVGNYSYNWTCGNDCYDWTVFDGDTNNDVGSHGWTCGNSCHGWTCGAESNNWSCGNKCSFWTSGNGCDSWICGNGCSSWACGYYCDSWICGNGCYNWTCGNNCSYWRCEDNCYSWTCGNNCSYWRCGNSCYGWICGNNCSYWRCGNSCYGWICGESKTSLQDYVYYFHLCDGIEYINIHADAVPTAAKLLQNFTIKQGVKGTNGKHLDIIIDTANFPLGSEYEWIIAKNSKGEIKQYCEADLIN